MTRRKQGTLSRFLCRIFANDPAGRPPIPIPASSSPSHTPSQPPDLGHALTALRKGWISREHLSAALQNCKPGDSVMKQLEKTGAVAPDKLAMLFASGMISSSHSTLRNLVDEEIAHDSPGLYSKGDTIGSRYRVLDIKRGGFGVVYICEAQQEETYARGNTLVALKALLRQHMATPEALELFYTEASNWISLGAHPNIVLAYGVEAHARTHMILMEYIEGAKTLADEIHAGRTDWQRALRVGIDVARALAYAQKQSGLVHGDLKPQNLLVTTSGAIKVADFGLSICQQAFNGGNTDDGILIGTEGFIAPEMYLGKTARTTATDIYAFGVILFQTATRHLPFPPGQSPPANLNAPPADVRQIDPEIPAGLAELILACMQPAPQSRPPGFDIIFSWLEEMHVMFLDSTPLSAPAPDAPVQADALVNLAQSWLELGNLGKARSFAAQAIKTAPNNWKAHQILGNIHREAGEHREAIFAFSEAHQLAPQEIAPAASAAYASHLAGDNNGATHWLERALDLCRSSGRYGALDGISSMLADQFTPNIALPLLDKILSDTPDAAMTWNNRAVLLRRTGDFPEALASADRAIKHNPTYAKAWTNRANILIELQRFNEALESADRTLALDPMVPGAYAARATALAQTGRLKEARQCIETGLSRLPANPLLLRAQKLFSS